MMDGGAESYKRYLEGDDEGFVEIVKEYKDGLILYLAGYSGSVLTAEELAEVIANCRLEALKRIEKGELMTAALYVTLINASVSGKTNSSPPVTLFMMECTEINSFCRI